MTSSRLNVFSEKLALSSKEQMSISKNYCFPTTKEFRPSDTMSSVNPRISILRGGLFRFLHGRLIVAGFTQGGAKNCSCSGYMQVK